MTARVAAIDIGTQSVRLLVSEGGMPVLRRAVVTHLGEGVRARHHFDPARLAATLEALARFRVAMDDAGVRAVRAVATEAVRLVEDPGSFLGPAGELLGTVPELLRGDEEGWLSFRGATAGLDPAGAPFVTVDLGGGSCEFAVGGAACEAVHSAAFGATVLTEAYLGADPPRADELSAALSVAGAHIDEAARAIPAMHEARTFLGLGGTFTTMAAVEIGLDPYDAAQIEGFELTRAAAEDVFRTLVTEPLADRLFNPGLPAERGRTILGGACAVVAIMRYFGLESVRVSERDLLDALVADLSH